MGSQMKKSGANLFRVLAFSSSKMCVRTDHEIEGNVMEYFKPGGQMRMTQPVSLLNNNIILIFSPGLKYSITFPFIAHMPLIDIQILAVCRTFVP